MLTGSHTLRISKNCWWYISRICIHLSSMSYITWNIKHWLSFSKYTIVHSPSNHTLSVLKFCTPNFLQNSIYKWHIQTVQTQIRLLCSGSTLFDILPSILWNKCKKKKSWDIPAHPCCVCDKTHALSKMSCANLSYSSWALQTVKTDQNTHICRPVCVLAGHRQ